MLGSLVGAAINFFGGKSNQRQAAKVAAEDRRFQSQQLAKSNALQKEFAQSGIQWRAQDAKKAGIHPLYAVGANVPTYTPSSIAGGSGGSAGPDYASMGQDVGRAISSTMDQRSRTAVLSQKLSLERQALENDLIRSQIKSSELARINQAGISPGIPSTNDRMLLDGQSGSGAVSTSAMARQASAPRTPSQEAGAVSEYGYVRTPSGHAPVMSKDAKDRLEEDLIGQLTWNLRNRVLPTVLPQVFGRPPDHNPKARYNPLLQQYDDGYRFLGVDLY